jgi:hypothetical protein
MHMTHEQHYGGAIWTNHALERLGQRGLSQQLAWQAFNNPDHHEKGKNPGTTEFRKRVGNSTVTVIAKRNERNEWIILSNWIDPPLPGTHDFKKREEYLKYKKASLWGKVWYTLKKQLGL